MPSTFNPLSLLQGLLIVRDWHPNAHINSHVTAQSKEICLFQGFLQSIRSSSRTAFTIKGKEICGLLWTFKWDQSLPPLYVDSLQRGSTLHNRVFEWFCFTGNYICGKFKIWCVYSFLFSPFCVIPHLQFLSCMHWHSRVQFRWSLGSTRMKHCSKQWHHSHGKP